MEKLFEIINLAILQGLTEFLPVSSSGHLALLGKFFHLDAGENLTIVVVLHLGSLAAIIFFYFQTLISLFKKENWRVVALVALASIPTAIAGLLLKKTGMAMELFDNYFIVGIGFFVSAGLLHFSEKFAKKEPSDEKIGQLNQIAWTSAVKIGLTQMVAIIPGISRSGSTISAGLWCKLDRQTAAAFSFLMAIPAIVGGGLLELKILSERNVEQCSAGLPSLTVLVIGFAVSAIVSFGALTLLVKLLKKGSWVVFSYYLILLGAATLIFGGILK